MKKIFISCLVFISLFIIQSFKPTNQVNYLTIPNPITFNKEKYSLSWSSHSGNLYKQEYLRTKDASSSFNKMIFYDVLLTDSELKEFVAKKMQEIENRKKTDPVANYQVLEKEETGEFLLDFLISDNGIYEWNAYRYKNIKTNKGNAVLLFAYCFRSFEKGNIKPNDFFPFIKKNRLNFISDVANYNIPNINITD